MTRLGIILIFCVAVVAESITLGVGWRIGSETRRDCEATIDEQQARGWRQADVKDCVAAHLFDGRAW